MLFRLNARTCLVAGLVCLQTADLICTYLLLDGGQRGDVYEANPVARTILQTGGWMGVALFKLSLTAVAVLAALLVSRRRPAVAVRLLGLLCALMLGVNAYSATLLTSPGDAPVTESQASENSDRLDHQVASTHEFCRVRATVCDAVMTGECDVQQACSRLAVAIGTYGPRMKLPRAARLPEPSKQDEVLAYLNYHLNERARERGLKESPVCLNETSAGPCEDGEPSPRWTRTLVH